MPWTKMVSMEMDDEAVMDMNCPIAIPMEQRAKFPYGLRITLTHDELEKLGLEADCEVGDILDLRAFARVTSVSMNETDRGMETRVELQIEELSVEDESQEEPDEEEAPKRNPLHDRS